MQKHLTSHDGPRRSRPAAAQIAPNGIARKETWGAADLRSAMSHIWAWVWCWVGRPSAISGKSKERGGARKARIGPPPRLPADSETGPRFAFPGLASPFVLAACRTRPWRSGVRGCEGGGGWPARRAVTYVLPGEVLRRRRRRRRGGGVRTVSSIETHGRSQPATLRLSPMAAQRRHVGQAAGWGRWASTE